jgi:hypothetical protein
MIPWIGAATFFPASNPYIFIKRGDPVISVVRECQTTKAVNIICILNYPIRSSWIVKYSRIGQMCQKDNNFRSTVKNYSMKSLLVMSEADKDNMSLAMQKFLMIGSKGDLRLRDDDSAETHSRVNVCRYMSDTPLVFICS